VRKAGKGNPGSVHHVRARPAAGKELVRASLHSLSSRDETPTGRGASMGRIDRRDDSKAKRFGHDKGAFTGAVSSKVWDGSDGPDGGTHSSNEVGTDFALALQSRLLRVRDLTSGQVVRSRQVPSRRRDRSTFVYVAATNRSAGAFAERHVAKI